MAAHTGNLSMSTNPPYTYEPLTHPGFGRMEDGEADLSLYCQAPKHAPSGELIEAAYIEIFSFPEDDPNASMNGRYPSCEGCHYDTLRSFQDEMLPELTAEEEAIMRELDD